MPLSAIPLPSPDQVTRPLRLLAASPKPLQRRMLTSVLNQALSTPLEEGELDFLNQRILLIHIDDLGIHWFITVRQGKLELAFDGQEDACIRGHWLSFARMACQLCDPDTLFFQRQLQISGDTELGLATKNLLDSVEPDTLPVWLQYILSTLQSYLCRLGANQ